SAPAQAGSLGSTIRATLQDASVTTEPLVNITSGPTGLTSSNTSTSSIRPGETVAWSGGPLTGTATAGPEFALPDHCAPSTCKDLLLDVRVPSPADHRFLSYVQIQIQTADPNQLSLFVYPPPGDTSGRFLTAQKASRLLAPQRGTWRIRVAC